MASALGLLLVLGATTVAQATEIATVPIPAAAAAALKPNIMLLMDTSESMTYTHMPDQVEFPRAAVVGRETVGYKSSTCNSIYYDPRKTYVSPKTANPLVDFPAQNFKSAEYDGFGPAYAPPVSAPVDLSKDFQAWDSNSIQNKGLQDPKQAAYYYVYAGAQTNLKWNSDACLDKDLGGDRPATNGGTWLRKVVSDTSGLAPHVDERTNFANWYSYYRSRILMTKSAASLAFAPMTDSFRVGFITVMPKNNAADTTVLPSKFLAIGDFNATQRALWFDKLFTQTPFGSSPAREGLARVGRYYGGQQDSINLGMPATGADDPLKYSCQQNFTIMTTDGYWNTQGESTTGFGGPLRLDGKTQIIQADGDYSTDLADPERHCPLSNPDCPWPIHDGAVGAVRTLQEAVYIYDKMSCPLAGLYRTKTQTKKQISQYTKTFSQVPKKTVWFTTTKEQDTETKRTITRLTTKRKMTTEQYVLSTDAETRTRWQVYESSFQYTKTTRQQTSTSKQMFQREYEIRKTENRQRETSSQNVQVRRQWLETRQQTYAEKRQFTVEKRQVEMRMSRIVGRQTSGESYAPQVTCPSGWQCQTLYDSPYPTFTAVDPALCNAGQDTANSPYWTTECRPGTGTQAPMTTANCLVGDRTDTAFPWIRTICTDAQLQGPTPVPFGTSTCNTNDGSNVRTICTTPANGNNQAYVDGASCQGTNPAFDPLTKAPYVADPGTSGSFVRIDCSYNLDETTYPPAACSDGVEAGGIHRSCRQPGTTNYTRYVQAGSCNGGTFPMGQTVSCDPIETRFPTAAVAPSTCTSSGWDLTVPADPWYRTCANVPLSPDTWVTYGSCAAVTGASSPYLVRECVEPTLTNYADRPVDPNGPACSPSVPSNGNNYLDVTCDLPVGANNQTVVVPPGGCTPVPNPSSPFVRVTCGNTPPSAEVGPVDQATCPIGDNVKPGDVVQRCRRVDLGSVVGVCNPGNSGGTTSPGNPATDWIQTDCSTGTSVTAVPNCGAYTLNVPVDDGNGRITTCLKPAGPNNTANLPVLACTQNLTPPSPYVYVTCDYQEPFPSAIVDPATCIPGEAGAEREFTTCTPNDAAQFVDECTYVPASSGNGWTETICTNVPGPNNAPTEVRGPDCGATVVGTPTVGYDANHVKTVCRKYETNTMVAGTPPCVDKAVASTPDWEVVSCGAAVQPFAPQLAGACTAGDGVDYPDVRTACSAETVTQAFAPSPPCTSGVVGQEKWTCTSTTIESNVPDSACVYNLDSGSPFTETTCSSGATAGEQLRRYTRRTTTVSKMSGTVVVGTPSVTSNDIDLQNVGSCQASVTVPASTVASNTDPAVPAGCGAWPCTTSVPGPDGSYNSLADVASYYYRTDLRPSMTNNVKPRGTGGEDDQKAHQHMTTFVVGLGVDGTLDYTNDYHVRPAPPAPQSSSIAFAGLRSGTISWPIWPDPAVNYANTDNYADARSIDDFWHTAVNGRGLYFSAKDPQGVVTGLGNALTSIAAQTGSGAADGASSFAPTAGNNYAYVTSYKTVEWSGDLQAFPIDLATGGLGTTQIWSAKGQLDLRVGADCDDRKIYLIRMGGELTSGGNENLVNFAWGSKTCANAPIGNGLDASEQAFLDSSIPVTFLSQFGGTVEISPMTDGSSGTVDQKQLFRGSNYVNFIRGQRQHEGYLPNTNRYYRSRVSVLGDFVGSQPVFVGAPFAQYQDLDYATFATTTRAKAVYVGGNDGMLHAFDADTGAERWAVIPRTVLPELWRLGDAAYAKNHRFFVDGSPVVGDVHEGAPANRWKTILVGGLNGGGRGFYALDVTDPLAPKALWEFNATGACSGLAGAKSDCNVGLSFGKPVITKLNGTWVVLLTSGYNNASPGDGGGYLYVVDANSGALIKRIDTGEGTSGAPSGLAQINNFVDDTFVDNTTVRAYGGDLLGNIWRFQFGPMPASWTSVKIGEARDNSSNRQPITTRPEIAEVDNKPMIFVGTGKLLGPPDTSDVSVQSLYGIVDTLAGVGPVYPDLRAELKPLQLTQTGSGPTATRTIKCPALMGTACNRTKGWYVDLQDPSQPATGERINIDMKLVFGTLVAATNVPSPDACSTGGYSWLSYLDYRTGLPISSATLTNSGDPASGNISTYMGDSLIAGFNIYQLTGSNNNPFFAPWVRLTSGGAAGGPPLFNPPPSAGKRISWREIAQ